MTNKQTCAAELEFATLKCQQVQRVLIVRMEAPPFNYMTTTMQSDFARLVRAVNADGSVGAVVVTGGVTGRYITHADIGDILTSAEAAPTIPRPVVATLIRAVNQLSTLTGGRVRQLLERTPLAGLNQLTMMHDALHAILRSPAVWIGAINGPCGGGGLELSVFFDVRIAAESAQFMLPELSIGLTMSYGGQRLAQLIHPARALEMMLEARAYTAAEAQHYGLVNAVVADDDLLGHSLERAARYARRPRKMIAAQKQILNNPGAVSSAESLIREAISQAVGISSPATRAALRRWLQLQDPSGDSTFLTHPEPLRDGTAVDMNPE